MTTATAPPSAVPRALRRPGRLVLAGAVIVGWVLVWALWNGRATLPLAAADLTPLHERINGTRDWVDANRNSSPVFLYAVNEIRLVLDGLTNALRALLAVPALGLPIPVLGWLGVVAVTALVTWFFGNLKVASLAVAGLVFVGLQGLWTEAMDTLAMTATAVIVAVVLGVPLGVLVGLKRRAAAVVVPVLDLMQILPTFVYLAPLTLLFLISPAAAAIATLIYAMPPVVRLTALAIQSVPRASVEAAESLGATGRQALFGVRLPMSRRTIAVGINQTIMAALSMVTIAALIDAPGLGKTVLKALQSLDVGTAFNSGLALVVLAVVLDRATTAAATRADVRPGARRRGTVAALVEQHRRWVALGALVLAAFAVYLSRTYQWAAVFPAGPTVGDRQVDLGAAISSAADRATTWVQDTMSGLTVGLKDGVTALVIDPLQALLTDTPWWGTVAAMVALAAIVAGLRAAIVSAGCLALVIATGLWQDSMVTLASTLVATVIVVVIGIVVGVWMGRSDAADRAVRPILDAAQVMPAFVYLVPCVALFDASRFTAVAAAVVFAAPVAIKIAADGIRGVSPTTVEAATAAGSSTAQVITKVQLPMAAPALTLATNQGLIYVLSMVVVGGLVGGGALGYQVVAGFSQGELFGKGLAAGLAIVLLGIMLDRVTQAAARRAGSRAG